LYTKWQSSKKKKEPNLAITIYKIPKTNPESLYILGYYWNLSLKSGDLKKKVFKIWQICAIFTMDNSFDVKIICLGRNLAKFQNFCSQ